MFTGSACGTVPNDIWYDWKHSAPTRQEVSCPCSLVKKVVQPPNRSSSKLSELSSHRLVRHWQDLDRMDRSRRDSTVTPSGSQEHKCFRVQVLSWRWYSYWDAGPVPQFWGTPKTAPWYECRNCHNKYWQGTSHSISRYTCRWASLRSVQLRAHLHHGQLHQRPAPRPLRPPWEASRQSWPKSNKRYKGLRRPLSSDPKRRSYTKPLSTRTTTSRSSGAHHAAGDTEVAPSFGHPMSWMDPVNAVNVLTWVRTQAPRAVKHHRVFQPLMRPRRAVLRMSSCPSRRFSILLHADQNSFNAFWW